MVTTVSGSTPKVSDTTPRVGQNLTATAGTWKPAPVGLSYQWYRGSTAIDGAQSATYQVQAADLATRLKVSITGSVAGLTSLVRSSKTTSKVARGYFATRPKPWIDNRSPVVDQQLTATAGVWAPAPDLLTYQWYKVSRRGHVSKLSGAVSATRTVRASDKGYRLEVKVTAVKNGFHSASRMSSRTAKVVQYTFLDRPRPVISGNATPGATLRADAGTWAPNPDQVSYHWNRAGIPVEGADEPDYSVTDADLGQRLTVTVTAAKSGYATTTVTSSAVTPVGPDSDLHVGTFNLSGMNTDSSASGDHEVWSKRMPVVVSQVLREQLDVLAVQEAYWGTTHPQYSQLRDALNNAGGTYEVVDSDKSTSAGDRILYNPSVLRLLDHGYYRFNAQTSGKQLRYLVWATFRSVATGKEFFFVGTHLDPYNLSDKVAEWRELIRKVPELNSGDLPVITVGDFNTTKWWDEAKELLPAMKAAGFGDVMNQQFQTNPPKDVRAEIVENGWINSFNGYRRDVTKYSYPTNHAKVGNGVDWIFATNSLRVKKWKVVADFNPGTLQITGVIPSDHCMLSAVFVL